MSIEAAQQRNAQCNCLCHTSGIKFVKTSFPGQICCSCNSFNNQFTVFPTQFDIKILQERIEKLESYREHALDQVRLFNDTIVGLAKEVASLHEGYRSLYVRVEALESELSLKDTIDNMVLEKTSDMTFGEAIEAMKRGCKVGCWHRDDIYVWLRFATDLEGERFMVKTISGKIYPWFPNHREILSENWRVIDAD